MIYFMISINCAGYLRVKNLYHALMKNALVVGGRRRLLADQKVRERIDEIARAIEARHERALARAGLVRRWLIRRRMRRELRREIDRLFPPEALYSRKQ